MPDKREKPTHKMQNSVKSKNSDFTIRIKPKSSWLKIDFKELWNYREVFYLLVWRDLKVRYKQTLLGILWVALQPVIATVIFAVIFTRFARFETDTIPYALIALSGFTLWSFINTAVSQASISLVYHEQLVTKIYFPRMIVPSASVGAGLIDLILTFLILLGIMFFYGVFPTLKILLVPFVLFFAVLITLSFSLLLASLNVRFRDVKFIVPFFLQIWMFASPVFYPSTWIPERFRPIFALNPVTGLIDSFRYVLYGTELNLTNFGISAAMALVLFFVSLFVFRAMEDDFADLL